MVLFQRKYHYEKDGYVYTPPPKREPVDQDEPDLPF
jgi:hypothetical protein